MTIMGIAENLVSDVLFLLIAVALGWMVFIITRRVRLLKFFGISKSRRIVIYLSNLRVKPKGAIGIDGKERSYQGSAACFAEMQVANRFRDLFNYLLPTLSDESNLLSRLLISDVRVHIQRSPLNQGQLERSSSFVALGSRAYNIASSFIETELHSQVRLQLGNVSLSTPDESAPWLQPSYLPPSFKDSEPEDEATPTLTPVSASGASIDVDAFGFFENAVLGSASTIDLDPDTDSEKQPPAVLMKDVPPITDKTCSFVERIVDHEADRSIFYVAGISELGTAGAAYFLMTEWERLHKKYGDSTSFVVMLRIEPTNFKRWSIVFEK